MTTKENITVQTALGKQSLDSTGSVVAAARIDPGRTYGEAQHLLQAYINDGSEDAWEEIWRRIDALYTAVRSALRTLESETAFMAEVKKQLNIGKKLFFKPNLVALPTINPVTHGPNLNGCCTPWEFQAAVMRWFHEEQGVSYYQMAVGEAGNTTPSAVQNALKIWGGKLTAQAFMEGRRGDNYGGWGFYFARQYLAESRRPNDTEDPMRGSAESLEGHSTPSGMVADKLLFYDLNSIADDGSDSREISIPDGINFKSVTIHKAIVGGDPNDPQDRKKWPGCVLVNLPKLKIHVSELLTCCLKNLGIGLYPIAAKVASGGVCNWKYGLPKLKVPCLKMGVPHQRWEPEYDPETLGPFLNKDGIPQYKRTGGLEASIADMVRALQVAGVSSIHVVDGVQCTNIDHSWTNAVSLPEGLIFAGLDPVAVDSAAARYLFSMVPMEKAENIRTANHLESDVIQITPRPYLEGKNIVTGQTHDSCFSRYSGLEHCEKRGLGQRRFYLIGVDLWEGGHLASVEGHLGRVEEGSFTELLTHNLYHTPVKYHIDLQAMSFAYLKANDAQTGSNYMQQLLEDLDENGDGVIDYLEHGRGATVASMSYGMGINYEGLEEGALLKIHFLLSMNASKLMRKEWNPRGLEIGGHSFITQGIGLAYRMSQDKIVHEHPMHQGRSYGGGMWPSLQYAIHKLEFARIYGQSYPDSIDLLMSPFGMAFHYADLRFNNSEYCTPAALDRHDDVIARYKAAVERGAKKLPFTIYVPVGMGRDWNGFLLNVEETDNKEKMFTATFGNGEIWDKLHLSEYTI